MDAQIEALRFTNAYPTDEVEQELRGRLQKHFDAVGHLDAEISALENRLKDLRARRDAEQRIIDQYKPFLSPLRRMAPEILGEIFYRCLPSQRNSIIRETECPLLLTRVCSRWRAVAISEQRLWAQIYITFEDKLADLISSWARRSPDSKLKSVWEIKRALVIENLRRRLDAIKEWLSRSGTTPLSISVRFTSGDLDKTCEAIRKKDHPVVLEFFEFLAGLSPRFKDLEISMKPQAYRLLESMMDVTAMTRLESLKVEIVEYKRYARRTPNYITLLTAPSLKARSVSTQKLGIVDPLHLSAWRGMTDFSCHAALRATELISLLEHTPNLIKFKAKMGWGSDTDQPLGFGQISLPFLRTFSILDHTIPRPTANFRIYNRIDAPGITWVNFAAPSLKKLEPSADSNEEDNSIVALLQRLPVLKKLSINTGSWVSGREGLRRIFKSTPSVTHLFCGYEERDLAGCLVRTGNHRTTTNDTFFKFGFGCDDAVDLLPLDILAAPLKIDTDNDLPLLPNLLSLEISERTIDITDEDLIKLITTRMRPPTSRPVVAQLKHVAVIFYRPQGDPEVGLIVKEHAKREGVEMIDLCLDYSGPPNLRMVEFHKPEYGLDSDGRTWRFLDAEEFTGL